MVIANFAKEYMTGLSNALEHIPLESFERVIESIHTAYIHGNSIFLMGNGGSASTASHFACDINKGVSQGIKKRFKMHCLSDNIPIMLAYANDQSYDDIFVEQLANLLNPDDVVIGISASGNSKNIIKAIQYANNHSALSIALTGFNGGRLGKISNISIVAPVDDMQKIEDIHLILTHIIMQILDKKLRSGPDEKNNIHDKTWKHGFKQPKNLRRVEF